MTRRYKYQPDTVSPPGATLADVLEENEMTQAALCRLINRPYKTINEIIKGKAALTPETAIQLERALGVPADFWVQREASYRLWLARAKK